MQAAQSASTRRLYRTDAVVLRRHDIGEADRVLTLYSPRLGKLRAVAKGARRSKSRLGGHVELFTHVNVLVARGRNLDIITQAETVRPFPHIRDDLWKAAYGCYVVELVDRFTEEQLENQPVFELLLEALGYLDTCVAQESPVPPAGRLAEQAGTAGYTLGGTVPPSGRNATGSAPPAGVVRETGAVWGPNGRDEIELSMRTFEVRLLGHLGYTPELYHCLQCGQRLAPVPNYFSAAQGGVLCAVCGEGQRGAGVHGLSVNAVKALRLMGEGPFEVFQRLRLPHDVSQEVEAALRAQIGYILERRLRASEALDRMKSDRARERRAS
jgi:DNA repair protein RecO (recombination protein O)